MPRTWLFAASLTLLVAPSALADKGKKPQLEPYNWRVTVRNESTKQEKLIKATDAPLTVDVPYRSIHCVLGKAKTEQTAEDTSETRALTCSPAELFKETGNNGMETSCNRTKETGRTGSATKDFPIYDEKMRTLFTVTVQCGS